jgi:tetratricopeptide (TPR) repeat protein
MSGRLEQGEKMYHRVQVSRDDALGTQSDESYQYKRALAALSNLQGKHAEAEAVHQGVIQFYITRHGLHHAETIKSINFLCDALVEQKKLDEALPWYRRIQDAYSDLDEKAREPALESLDHLARALWQLGQLEEAERIARHMTDEREKLLGMNDPDTALGYHTLAGILTQQEQFQPALDMYEVAYTRLKDRSGAEHEDVIDFLNDLNAAKNRLLQWSGGDNRVSMNGEEAMEKETATPPIFAFQSPNPIRLELQTV